MIKVGIELNAQAHFNSDDLSIGNVIKVFETISKATLNHFKINSVKAQGKFWYGTIEVESMDRAEALCTMIDWTTSMQAQIVQE